MTYLPNLQAEMQRFGIDEVSIAIAAKRTKKTVQNWFNGIGEPSFSQAKAIRDLHFPDFQMEYLFAKEPITNETKKAS